MSLPSLSSCCKRACSMRQFFSLLLIFSICALDQLTKYLVCSFSAFLPLSLTSFFSLVFTTNRGVSFGMLNNGSSFAFYSITTLVIGICFYLTYWLWTEKNKSSILSLSFILGGALGNLMDRFFRQGVVDFLDFHIQSYHWPAFNVADSFIFVGVLLLLWSSKKEKRTK